MLFNSYIFILFFLPISLIGYFVLNHVKQNTIAKAFLLFMSLWFYGYFNAKYVFVIVTSILCNFVVITALEHGFKKKIMLVLGLFFDLGLLFYFKYFDFFLENVNVVFGQSFVLRNIVLPLGISFFTFQQISFVVDAYRGETLKTNFLDYAVFITFFPQLIAGPIVTHDELIPQLQDEGRRTPDYENLSRGLLLFAIGLFKKVIIADTFGNVADWGFDGVAMLSSLDALVVIFSYTMQIYFDFSAYSDMAIGIGRMFNMELPLNFNSPYKAYSILDFWKRWHMTLTRFLTKYVYIPLGGNQKGKARTYLNIMLVFMLSGLWHGAAWTFVLWGFLHGIANVLTRVFNKQYDKLHKVVQWVITFTFVNATWMIFRAESFSQIGDMLYQLAQGGISLSNEIGALCKISELDFIENVTYLNHITDKIKGFDMLVFYGLTFFSVLGLPNAQSQKFPLNRKTSILTVTLLIICLGSLSGVMSFLYFNF